MCIWSWYESQDPGLAYRGATAAIVGFGLPLALFAAFLSLGAHPLSAALATALLPVKEAHFLSFQRAISIYRT